MPKKEIISVVIPHWNTPEELAQTLERLSSARNLEIVVVDNDSLKSPISLKTLTPKHPNVKFILNEINRGYAFACNQGVLESAGDWILFLNPDTDISVDQINQLVQFAQENKHDAVSPHSSSAGYEQPLPTAYSLLSTFTPLGRVLPVTDAPLTLWGGCLLIKRSVLEKIGGWDERFFVWFEDCDLTARLLDNGYAIAFAPLSVRHGGGESFKQMTNQFKRDLFFHSMSIYAKKHFNRLDQSIVSLITKRFSKTTVLPTDTCTVSITIPNMKKPLLASFLAHNYDVLKTKETEVIIVTSALSAHQFFDVKKEYPNIRLIIISENYGFAHTVNIGLRTSGGKYIGTLNDDTIIDASWIETSLKGFADGVGGINPILQNAKQEIESVGITIEKKGKAHPNVQLPNTSSVEVDALNGAAVLFSKNALQQVGIFDERFGSYLEDIDLSLRLRRAGFSLITVAKTRVIHMKHQTANTVLHAKKSYLDFKNWIFVISKNWSLSDLLRYSPSIIVERGRNLSGLIKSLLS